MNETQKTIQAATGRHLELEQAAEVRQRSQWEELLADAGTGDPFHPLDASELRDRGEGDKLQGGER